MADHSATLISQLRTTLGKMEVALSTIAEAIVWTNHEGMIEWCNTAFDCLVARQHLEVLGAQLSELLPLEQQGQSVSPEMHPVKIVLQLARSFTEIYEFHKQDKRAILEISGAQVRFDQNNISAVLAIRDITEQKKSEESLKLLNDMLRIAQADLEKRVEERTIELSKANEDLKKEISERKRVEEERSQLLIREQKAREEAESANRVKDEFLATVSHELRTPLTPMLGWIKMLCSGRLDQAASAQALEVIERNVRLQAHLVDDLLDVSRIITGKLHLDIRSIELAGVIETTVNILRPTIDTKQINLQMVIEPEVGAIAGDPDRLQQVVWNLLSNAIKFTPKGGQIEIRLERINSKARITVSDTGEGISPEFLPYMFERFRQADSSRTRKYGGLGLGLAIVRHLVELHGGTVHADSLGVGQGAKITVELPLLAITTNRCGLITPHTNACDDVSVAYTPLIGLRVLVVDDEPDTRELLTRVLTKYGADVKTCASATETLELLPQWQPDVLLADIGMSVEDGYDLIRKVRALQPQSVADVPAAALTAYASSEDRLRALSAGFQVHVSKPVEPNELIAVIAGLAGRSG
ncbi:MAG: ATP-binding protein [Acidobacteriota bacterium]